MSFRAKEMRLPEAGGRTGTPAHPLCQLPDPNPFAPRVAVFVVSDGGVAGGLDSARTEPGCCEVAVGLALHAAIADASSSATRLSNRIRHLQGEGELGLEHLQVPRLQVPVQPVYG